MLNKEITAILNKYNDVDGIANIITKSLIHYYSVNGLNRDHFKENYLNYLNRVFFGRRFHFLDIEKLLSCKDQIFSAVMTTVCKDLTDVLGSDEVYQSCQWQPKALEKVLAELFDNRLLLSIINR
ncbi:hypothetical protein QMA77_21105 [Pantoea ananatis]|uniref:hypothetical protein n=1 Tax=Pantoea ananas TaxID=553 RepID=UPI0006A22129|nr:hypothetical protein [Pantoea ananatis]KNA28147.1 hypothetical protein ACO03_03910 [Pantoea ananatis]MDI6539429.1 hypothetical protein [Pantoea ananatis]